MTDFPQRPDRTYRRHNRRLLVAQIKSLVPKLTTFDPSIYDGGNGNITWEKVQRFFARDPSAQWRNNQMPMHFYMEYVGVQGVDDYFIYVGEAVTNRSWFLQEAVAAGVLPVEYADAVLVVLQENYSIETIQGRLWLLLADRVLTPLQREWRIPRSNIEFYELVANREIAASDDWRYMYTPPTFLDPFQLELFLKEFEKR